MTNYVTTALHKLQHPTPWRYQYEPHQWTRPNYVATKQLETILNTTPPIPEGKKYSIQEIVGNFLYYASTVDCTMISSFNTILEQQANPTQNTEATITHFLEYTGTNPTAIIQYKASNMLLHIDSDESYICETWEHSHTEGHY